MTKTYVAEGRFGFGTDTEDITGNPLQAEVTPSTIPTWEVLAATVASFTGKQDQTPSIYSAIKINGRRAYELAREGVEFTLPARSIEISECSLLAYSYPYFTIRVTSSAGTYIRALLRDIAAKIGIPATMTQLARTAVGEYTIDKAVTAEELAEKGEGAVGTTDSALMHLPMVIVSENGFTALKQGKQWPYTNIDGFNGEINQMYRAYSDTGFFGIVTGTATGLKVVKNIF